MIKLPARRAQYEANRVMYGGGEEACKVGELAAVVSHGTHEPVYIRLPGGIEKAIKNV